MSAFTDAIERNLSGIEFVSTGISPGCKTCMANLGFKSLRALNRAWESGEIADEASFSWRPCQSCGSRLGGDREPLHGVIDEKIYHWDGACVDCILYINNGQEPEDWKL